jgi:hypothetical protein
VASRVPGKEMHRGASHKYLNALARFTLAWTRSRLCSVLFLTRPSSVFADLRGTVTLAFASKTNSGSGTAFRIERLCIKSITERPSSNYTTRFRDYGMNDEVL